jgi:hypothetical protein
MHACVATIEMSISCCCCMLHLTFECSWWYMSAMLMLSLMMVFSVQLQMKLMMHFKNSINEILKKMRKKNFPKMVQMHVQK